MQQNISRIMKKKAINIKNILSSVFKMGTEGKPFLQLHQSTWEKYEQQSSCVPLYVKKQRNLSIQPHGSKHKSHLNNFQDFKTSVDYHLLYLLL